MAQQKVYPGKLFAGLCELKHIFTFSQFQARFPRIVGFFHTSQTSQVSNFFIKMKKNSNNQVEVAHGLYNQLGVVMGNLEMIYYQTDNQQIKDQVKDAMSASKKALALVDSLNGDEP